MSGLASQDAGSSRPRRRTILTTGLVLALAGAGGLHLLARVNSGGWIALASAALGALPIVALLTRPRLDGLRASVLVHGQPVAGQQSDVTLTLTNTGRRLAAATTVVDELPGHDRLVVAFPALRPGASASVRCGRRAVHRTSSTASAVSLRATSPVGLVTVEVARDVTCRVVVHPAPATPRMLPTGVGGEGAARTTASAPGTEILGLRDWRHGESARAVAARASARHGRPLVLEREREGAPTLVVAVGRGTGPRWEAGLSEAASLAVAALRDGRPLILRGLPGIAQTPKGILDAFAAADHAAELDEASLHAALLRAGPGGALVVVAGTLAQADVDGAFLRVRRAAARVCCAVAILDERLDA